jgi:hypothetical protein
MGIEMAWNNASRVFSMRLAEGSRMLPPERRPIEVRLATGGESRSVVFEGRPAQTQF